MLRFASIDQLVGVTRMRVVAVWVRIPLEACGVGEFGCPRLAHNQESVGSNPSSTI